MTAQMVADHKSARALFEREGFHVEALLRHDLRTKTLAEAARAPVRGDVHADLTDFVCPSERIYMKTCITCEKAVRLGQQSDRRAALNILDPVVDRCRIADVAAQEEQILLGQGIGEFEDFGLVSRSHQPYRNLPGLRHPKGARIAARSVPGSRQAQSVLDSVH
jgi:hypothetical protein